LARAQGISRQMVYNLINGFNAEGADFLLDKKVGRPCVGLNGEFVEKVEFLFHPFYERWLVTA